MNRRVITGIVLLALTLPAWWIDARVLLACWLAAWWWCVGLVLGGGVNVWMHRLTGGMWGYPLRVVAIAAARRMPWLLLGLVVIAATVKVLYPWAAHPQGDWRADVTQPAFTFMWLTPGFFVARLVVYAFAFWWLARSITEAIPKGRAAAALIVYSLLTSLAAVDLVASLLPVWYSTAFGLVVLSVQAIAGSALGVLVSARVASSHLVRRSAGEPPLGRDLGNLLLMWVMSWGYLAFMQFLIIWAENLPREIAWYVPRLHTGWVWGAIALVIVEFAVPFVALLFRRLKDDPRRLAWAAWWLLAASAFNAAWLVLPSVDPHTLHGWWLLPLSFAGMGLAAFGGLPAQLREFPLPSRTGAMSDARA